MTIIESLLDEKSGLFQTLKSGKFPEFEISLSNETIIKLATATILVIVISILLAKALK